MRGSALRVTLAFFVATGYATSNPCSDSLGGCAANSETLSMVDGYFGADHLDLVQINAKRLGQDPNEKLENYAPKQAAATGMSWQDSQGGAAEVSLIESGARKFVPRPWAEYRLEAYITYMKSWSLEKCGNASRTTFARWGAIGNYSTGCLSYSGKNNWFSDTGYSNCYTSLEGPDPEITVYFEAFVNQAGDVCEHDPQDSCHLRDHFTISTTNINDINVWINGQLGDYMHAHELNFVYRLIELSTTTTTTPSPAVCKVFGDPHIVGFDNAKVSLLKVALLNSPVKGKINLFDNGDFWLVKNYVVSIQGRFHTHPHQKRSYLRVLAVGGSFLWNNTLRIGGYTPTGAKVFWNDEQILPTVGSVFKNNLISAVYRNDTQLVQDEDRTAKEGFEVKLPLGMHLLVNRGKNGLGLMITSPKLPGKQDGECGNYNGDSADDTAELIADRIGNRIDPGELLFAKGRHKEDDSQSLSSSVYHAFSKFWGDDDLK